MALAFSEGALAQRSETGPKVVVLFDTNTFSPWKRLLDAGIEDYISNNQLGNTSNARLAFEFLGLGDYSNVVRPDPLIGMLKYKQATDPASVVISALPPAAIFLESFGNEIYPGVPRIYIHPGPELAGSLITHHPENTKLIQSFARQAKEKTLTLIPTLLPQAQHLFVASGSGVTDLVGLEEAKSILNGWENSIAVSFLVGLPVDELLSTVASLPENSAIFVGSYLEDRDGTPYNTGNVVRAMVEQANAPIFVSYDAAFLETVVGGNLTNTRSIGELAGAMAVALLAGNSADFIPSELSDYRFNHSQLQRWGIDERLLPPASIIENQEFGPIERYSTEIILLFTLLGALLLLVAYLKHQAAQLKGQKILFESVIASIPDAVLLTDADANIFAANSGACAIFDFGPDELIGMNTLELIDPGTDPDNRSEIVTAAAHNNEPQMISYKKKTGESFSGETISTQITNAESGVLGNFALIRDVSKRLSRETEQRQGQKMEALGNLVGGISHDFNNVLGVISGYTQLSLVAEDFNPVKNYLEKILAATERAKSLVGQIMSFSRDNSSEQKPTNLDVLLEETMKLLNVSIPSHIEITVDLDEALKPVMGSEVQIQQIIINLATNAYQAMRPGGGKMVICLEREVVSKDVILSHGVLAAANYSVLSITDNGPGMSDEVASRMFDPFFTTKERGEGSGMGSGYCLQTGEDSWGYCGSANRGRCGHSHQRVLYRDHRCRCGACR